jgi:Helix-turn-helix domain
MTTIPAVLLASDAARLLSLSQSTLAKLRLTGKGPAYCKLGRRVVYRLEDLTAWLEKNRRLSTSESGDGRRR